MSKPRSKGRIRPPRSGIGAVTGWKGQIFTKDDILWLAEEADYPPPADPEASAMLLDGITRDAIGYIGAEDAISPASEHRNWHQNIHKHAIALLEPESEW